MPIREETSPYVVRHGQGYSRFEHISHGISLELLQYVPLDDPIKISRLKIQNRSGRSRRLSVTAYVEWVLGTSRGASAPFVVTEIDAETGAMLARNPWSNEFGGRVAFADLAGRQVAWTGDRTEFLGRNGTLDHPAALAGSTPLSNRVGAGLDPCAALQTQLELEPNGQAEIVFFLGEAATKADALALIARYRSTDLDVVFRAVTGFWDDVLGVVQVKTPDRTMDVLLNRWLLYQTLACRVWARSAFYQASGAYGFRDQLQDVMALTRVAAGADARASPASRRAAVCRGRRSALVATDIGHGGAHADLRRPHLVAVRRRALHRGHGRSRGSRRDGSLSRRAGPSRRRARLVLSAHGFRGAAPRCSNTALVRLTGVLRSVATACR